jgi:hypothetical protein
MELLTVISIVSIVSGLLSALYILLDTRLHPQHMPIMRAVWVLTGLWASWVGLCLYCRLGRHHDMSMSDKMPDRMPMPPAPLWHGVVRSTLHCGAGCTLADLVGESLRRVLPVVVGGSLLWGGWVVDYLLALLMGIYFQYVAIRAMQPLSRGRALWQALKADFLSLTAWQAGMVGWMLFLSAYLPQWIAVRGNWNFWFAMQIAMCIGFCIAYPVNVLLIRWGVKRAMMH